MKKPIRWLCAVLTALMSLGCCNITAAADELPYGTYTYVDGEIKNSPAMIRSEAVIAGTALSDTGLKTPQDIYVFDDTIYIADTDNNRILVCDMSFQPLHIIETVELEGTASALSSPKGLFVDQEYVCIADTSNARVLILDHDFQVAKILWKPKDSLYDQNREFRPQKVIRDSNGYFYVISSGTYEGAVLYNPDGSFNSFFGGNKTTVTLKVLVESMWRKFMNKVQLSKVEQVIPQEYGGFDIDSNNFIFTCTSNTTAMTDQVKKLNPLGNNVWKTGVNYGDTVVEYSSKSKVVSRFVDVAVSSNGIVTAVDSERGHIFQYSAVDGRILAVSGNSGMQQGTFGTPAAVAAYEDKLYVLDSAKASVTVYSYTEYGSMVCRALELYNDGKYDESIELWQDVLKQNGNMQLAYCGIGKGLLGKGEYRQAMQYFKTGMDKEGYSEAYALQRKIVLRKNAGWLFLLAAVLVAVFLIRGVLIRKKDSAEIRHYKNWQYPFHIMLHPGEGYKDLHWTGQESLLVATVIFLIWLFSNLLRKQTTAFLFNDEYAGRLSVNIWTYLLVLTALALSFVVINWAICTLFEGKGTLKRVYIYSAYSLVPISIGNFLYVVLSYVFSLQEAAFLSLLSMVFTLWTVLLLLRGLSILHEYSLRQVVLSVLSTALGMAIVVFLVLLLVSLFNKVASFVVSIVNESILHAQR